MAETLDRPVGVCTGCKEPTLNISSVGKIHGIINRGIECDGSIRSALGAQQIGKSVPFVKGKAAAKIIAISVVDTGGYS